ncbi:MAG: polysaccharide pyruvyl transferase family protein [Maricaulis sp.]|uniref:polysaccharide pyruvyl transferase family protein n=1 Tax=Maricaulis sp. TaxID=1486257 RepID=UPI001B101747|nr:polysaccharide pyruvyl transferase family protein [Maricaulis sp.]MBO6729453.1 polysaccharide pyruvyl transferase family protein [Maricaulis sp.]MBO6878830.1 polysaccharide pyruvyl transferase family protein [Maricaulis sp.]
MTTSKLMSAVGQNSGNLVFQYACRKLIRSDATVIGQDVPRDPVAIREQADVIVIPSANFLREGLSFGGFVGLLDRCQLPLVFIGLGAQAESAASTKLNLDPTIERMIALMKERSESVSVRGDFTASVLEYYGLDNVVITGCPSNFISENDNFAETIAHKAAQGGPTFLTHAEEPWPKVAEKTGVERRLIEWTRKGRAMMIQQSVPAVFEYLRRDNPAAVDQPSEDFEVALAAQLMPGQGVEAFRDFAATRLRSYISVEQWMEDSARFDFSIGMRLHGNMVAWQAGVPAMWIHHDARTSELVETMGLPNLSLAQFMNTCTTVEDARKQWSFDPAAYTKRRNILRGRLKDVLQAQNISTTL